MDREEGTLSRSFGVSHRASECCDEIKGGILCNEEHIFLDLEFISNRLALHYYERRRRECRTMGMVILINKRIDIYLWSSSSKNFYNDPLLVSFSVATAEREKYQLTIIPTNPQNISPVPS